MLNTYHSPSCRTFTNVQNESTDYLLSLRGMRDFRMKLDTKEWFRVVGDSREGCSARFSNDMKVGWDLVYLVTVRHPDLVTSVRQV